MLPKGWGRAADRVLERAEKDYKERFFEGIDIFTILIVVMVSWVYTYVKTFQIVRFKSMQLSYVKYISVKLNLKR